MRAPRCVCVIDFGVEEPHCDVMRWSGVGERNTCVALFGVHHGIPVAAVVTTIMCQQRCLHPC